MSFAFAVDGDDGQDFSGPDSTGLLTRTVKRAILLDVSPVFSPAYPVGTSVAARAADYLAAHPVISDQTAIHAQITAFESLQADKKRQRIAAARSRFAEYSPLSAEDIVRCKKLGYSEDLMLELRAAAYARQIGGPTFEAGPLRQEPGQTSDPTDSLRADDDFGWDDDDWDADKHERAASYHRALASKAPSVEKGVQHFKAADLHSAAARLYPDLNSSFVARAASKSLRREKENCL
jgi:hypothetical protein